jgi:hypothetical protein
VNVKPAAQPFYASRARGLALCLILLCLFGCAAEPGAYRGIYGPGPWKWNSRQGYSGASDPDRDNAPSQSAAVGDRSVAEEKPLPGIPLDNLGRPEPPPSQIPGISDIPEIPDEPAVLPE